jgi:hypothetical protein
MTSASPAVVRSTYLLPPRRLAQRSLLWLAADAVRKNGQEFRLRLVFPGGQPVRRLLLYKLPCAVTSFTHPSNKLFSLFIRLKPALPWAAGIQNLSWIYKPKFFSGFREFGCNWKFKFTHTRIVPHFDCKVNR